MARALFWLGAATIAYVYAGYPLVLAAWARLRSRPVAKAAAHSPMPGVSIIVAARNEAPRLRARLANLASQAYAGERQIVVVSDGSTDGTVRVASRFSPEVEIVVCPALGKAAALNAGVARARHHILVFADCRQSFAADTLRQLVANFADPAVGAVSGELVFRPDRADDSSVADGVGIYWQYEKWLRRRESRVHSTLGVTGAVYAMRRDCWQPLPPQTILDDVLGPMRAVLAGRRVVFDEAAIAFDDVAPDAPTEARRKVRTLAGNYQLVWLEPRLLLPVVNPLWFQFVSHKLGRLVVPYALIACFLTSAMLAEASPFYAVAFAAQLTVAVLAAYGAWLEGRVRGPQAPMRPPVATVGPTKQVTRPRSKKVVNA